MSLGPCHACPHACLPNTLLCPHCSFPPPHTRHPPVCHAHTTRLSLHPHFHCCSHHTYALTISICALPAPVPSLQLCPSRLHMHGIYFSLFLRGGGEKVDFPPLHVPCLAVSIPLPAMPLSPPHLYPSICPPCPGVDVDVMATAIPSLPWCGRGGDGDRTPSLP